MTINSSNKKYLLYFITGFVCLFCGSYFLASIIKQSFFTEKSASIELAANQNLPSTAEQEKVDKILALIKQRLLIANDVARWKWNQNLPIEDPQREQQLLNKVRQEAKKYGLGTEVVTAFFQAQIAASKLIQKKDFQNWQQQRAKKFTNVKDLNQVIRPSLDKLNTEFFAILVELKPLLGCHPTSQLIKSRTPVIIVGDGIDSKVQNLAIAPLLKINNNTCPGVKSTKISYIALR